MSAVEDRREATWLSLRYIADDGSQHWPAGDNWKADLLRDLDLVILDAVLGLVRAKVTVEMRRRFGAA